MADEYPETEAILDESTQAAEAGEQGEEAQVTSEVTEQQPVAEDWDGSKFALKFRNKEIVPESRDKLLMWAQQGYNAENKFSEIKKLQEQIDSEKSQYSKYAELAQAFESNPKFKQQIFDMYYQSQIGGQQQEQPGQQDISGGSLPPEVAKEISELKGQVEEWHSQQAMQELEKEVGILSQKYSEYDWNTPDENGVTLLREVQQAALNLGGVPLEVAFRHLAWDTMQEKAKASALESQKAERQRQSTKGKPVGSTVAQPKKVQQAPNLSSMSWDQVARQAISEIGG